MLNSANPLRLVLDFRKGHTKWLLIAILFGLLDVVVSITTPVIFKRVVDVITIEKDLKSLYLYVLVILFLLLLGTLNIYMRKISSARFTIYTIRKLRDTVTNHIQKIPYVKIKKHSSGDLAAILNDDAELIKGFSMELSEFVYQPLIFICAVTYGAILSWKLLLATFIVLLIAMMLNSFVSNKLGELSKILQEYLSQANSLIQDTIQGIYIVKAFNLQKEFKRRYSDKQLSVYEKEMCIVKRRLYIAAIMTLLFVVPMLVINIYGGHLAFTGDMTLGEFVAFLAIISYLTNPISKLISLISDYKIASGGAARIKDILDYPLEQVCKKVELINECSPKNTVDFNGISFYHLDRGKEILKDVSFTLHKGKTLALVGPSGSGKSTILNILCGFETPDAGELKILGEDVNKIGLNALRDKIAMVTQETYIYPTTVFENIAVGKRGATRVEVEEAAKKANAHQFILDLPQGYHTPLTEGGSNLSGGQKQRIAIARAILKDAPILLLDEPTSALDGESESLIDDALSLIAKDKSVVIVAHRLSTIIRADEIIVLSEGRVVERGTHEQLLFLDGMYKDMYMKQHDFKHPNLEQREVK